MNGSKENASYTLSWKHSGEDRLQGGSGGTERYTARESEKEYESKVILALEHSGTFRTLKKKVSGPQMEF